MTWFSSRSGRQGSGLERALVLLVAGSTSMHPDDLGVAVAEAGAELGGRDTELLLADLDQVVLRLMPAPGAATREVQIDGTSAGDAFRTETAAVEPLGDRVRLWVPILDSAERIGVLGTTLHSVDGSTVWEWSMLADLIGELVVTKARFGDGINQLRRSVPLSATAEVRWALLPPLTFTAPDLVVAGLLEPTATVAGDAFDYGLVDDTLHVAIFDAVGHGEESSRLATAAVVEHRRARRAGESLPQAVASLDRAITEGFGDAWFATGQLAELEVSSGRLTVANAGHPLPLLLRGDGPARPIEVPPCPPFGAGAKVAQPSVIQLEEGDAVLFLTDGLEEARRGGAVLGPASLLEVVNAARAGRVRPAEVLRQVVLELRRSTELRDDASLLLIGWRWGEHAVAPAARPGDGAPTLDDHPSLPP